ncbi:hypothetical protein GCM10007092_03360 [Thermus composti]|nr:hypothetical protein GCM10007092_03360 [Thermus composti]
MPRPQEQKGQDHPAPPPPELQGAFQKGGALVLYEAQEDLHPKDPFQALPKALGQGLGPWVWGAVGGEDQPRRG